MKLDDFYKLMEELEATCTKYNMHITHFIAGDTIELTIDKETENDK